MKQEQQSQNKPEASTPQAGNNPVVDLMLKNKIPLTRENYLNVAYIDVSQFYKHALLSFMILQIMAHGHLIRIALNLNLTVLVM